MLFNESHCEECLLRRSNPFKFKRLLRSLQSLAMTLVLIIAVSTVSLANSIKPGERIYYKIVKMGLKAGEATLSFMGPKVYHKTKTILIIFQARGFNFLDEERIYVNPKSFKPLYVERNLNIFGKKERILEEYTPGHVTIIKGKDQQTIDKPGDVDNIYAFIYRYRQQGTFKIDEAFDVHLPTKDIKIKLVKQEQITAAKKKYDAFYMESDPSDYKIWLDASEKRIPLRISGAIKMANADMVMIKYEN
jgi:hypothetical protein